MKDFIFFTAAALLAWVMVATAMANDPRKIPTSPLSVGNGRRDLVHAEGINLNRFRETPRNTVTLLREKGQNATVLITSRRNEDLPTEARDVPYLPITTDLEVAWAQKNLKVTVRARSAPKNGAPAMRLQYSAGADGHSDWFTFLMTPEWQDYTFSYVPPPSPANLGLDYLGVWADPDGLGRGVEVSKVTFDARAG